MVIMNILKVLSQLVPGPYKMNNPEKDLTYHYLVLGEPFLQTWGLSIAAHMSQWVGNH